MWVLPEIHKTGTDETRTLSALFPLLCADFDHKNHQIFIHKRIKHILAKDNIQLNWFDKTILSFQKNETNVKNFSLICLRLIKCNQYQSIPRKFIKKNALFLFTLSCALNKAEAAIFFSCFINTQSVKSHEFFSALCNTEKKVSCSKIWRLIDKFIGDDMKSFSGLLEAQVLKKAMTSGNNELLILMASKMEFSEQQWRIALQYIVDCPSDLEFQAHRKLLLSAFERQKSSFKNTPETLFYALYKEIVNMFSHINHKNVYKWMVLIDDFFLHLERPRQIFVSLGVHIRKSFQTVLSAAVSVCKAQSPVVQVFLRFIGESPTNDLFKTAYLSQHFNVANRLLEFKTFNYFKGFQYIKIPEEYDRLSSWRFKGKLLSHLNTANCSTKLRRI